MEECTNKLNDESVILGTAFGSVANHFYLGDEANSSCEAPTDPLRKDDLEYLICV